MSWVKLDERANEHPKLVAAGPEAAWLWVCGLMYCNRQKAHDGFIPDAALPALCGSFGRYHASRVRALAEKLGRVGLWHRGENGYRVHDYHDFQLTKEQVTELSEKRKSAGSLGAKARHAKQVAKQTIGKSLATEIPIVKQSPSKPPSKSLADPDPDPDPEERSLAPPTVIQNGKSEPGSGTLRRAGVLRTEPEPEIEAKRAESLRRLAELEADPSFATGGRKP